MALIEQDDVARLFRGLVEVLARHDPTRLRAGFEVAELYQQILPYRKYRNQLDFATNQDYEGAVLGLLAGLGGYAAMEPVEAQETLAAEAASPNPDPTLFHEFAGARVRLNAARVDQILAGEASYAPPKPPPPPAPMPPPPIATPAPQPPAPRGPVFELAPEPEPEPAPARPPSGRSPGGPVCAACAAALPADRPVVFCPFCGTAVGAGGCARCGDELLAEWQFCPRCGYERRP